MDKKSANKIVRDTLEAPFKKEAFVYFIKNLLNRIEEAPFVYRGNFIRDSYEKDISTLERVGKYTDGEPINKIVVNVSSGINGFFGNATVYFSLLGVVVIILIISLVVVVVNRFGGEGSGRSEAAEAHARWRHQPSDGRLRTLAGREGGSLRE